MRINQWVWIEKYRPPTWKGYLTLCYKRDFLVEKTLFLLFLSIVTYTSQLNCL